MFLFKKPTPSFVREVLNVQLKGDYTYSAVGATASQPPPGYDVDHTRVRIGTGRAAFEAGKSALREWQHFQLGWVEPSSPRTPIAPGEVVAIVGRVCGIWSLNACRIVYVIDEDGAARRFGFAYGTLPEHIESGEERFAVEWYEADDSVWYDILAFSRPNQFLARVGYPVVRRLQRRFARDSAAAMVSAARPIPPR